jgi:hypothetical protein
MEREEFPPFEAGKRGEMWGGVVEERIFSFLLPLTLNKSPYSLSPISSKRGRTLSLFSTPQFPVK